MKNFTLSEIASACAGRLVATDEQSKLCITSVERDSRQIKPGSLFLAIKGERVDGHDYIETCYQNGAICALCEKPPKTDDMAYILVDSTLEAVKKIARETNKTVDLWRTHRGMIQAVRDIRNPSAHGSKDHRISLEEKNSITNQLLDQHGLMRLVEIVKG